MLLGEPLLFFLPGLLLLFLPGVPRELLPPARELLAPPRKLLGRELFGPLPLGLEGTFSKGGIVPKVVALERLGDLFGCAMEVLCSDVLYISIYGCIWLLFSSNERTARSACVIAILEG